MPCTKQLLPTGWFMGAGNVYTSWSIAYCCKGAALCPARPCGHAPDWPGGALWLCRDSGSKTSSKSLVVKCRGLPYSAQERDVREFFEGCAIERDGQQRILRVRERVCVSACACRRGLAFFCSGLCCMGRMKNFGRLVPCSVDPQSSSLFPACVRMRERQREREEEEEERERERERDDRVRERWCESVCLT